jgi:hypothetical protein
MRQKRRAATRARTVIADFGVGVVTSRWFALPLVALASLFAFLGGGAEKAFAPTCVLDPEVRAYTVNQGLNSHARLVRGKETLVRFYVGLPSCADIANGAYIQVRRGELTVKNGTTLLNQTPLLTSPQTLGSDGSPPTFPNITTTGTPTLADAPADLKFVIPGSVLAPGTTAAFTATLELKLFYKSAATRTATLPATEANKLLTTIAGTNTKFTKAVDKKTRAIRILAVPLGTTPLPTTASDALQAAMQTLTRIFPVPAGTQMAQATSTALPTTGGIRYAINGGAVDLSGVPREPDGRICGSLSMWNSIKPQLAGFYQTYKTANPANPADRVVGVIDASASVPSSTNASCDEGRASTLSEEAWIRAVPGVAGGLLGQEVAHTFGAVPSGFSDTNYHTTHPEWADWATGDTARAYNVTDRLFLPRSPSIPAAASPAVNRSVMKYRGINWGNDNTFLEAGDYGYGFIGCKLGGTPTSACKTSGTTGTDLNVPASPTDIVSSFVLTGTVDASGLTPAFTILESYKAATLPTPQTDINEASASPYRLIQKYPGGQLDQGVRVSFDDTDHPGDGAVTDTAKGLVSIAYPLANINVNQVQLVYRPPTGGSDQPLYRVDGGAAPTITVGGGGGPVILGGGPGGAITSASTTATAVETTKGGQTKQPREKTTAFEKADNLGTLQSAPTELFTDDIIVTADLAYRDIASEGPLTHVYVGNDLSCQVNHQNEGTTGEFYPPDSIPGDCGTFLAVDGDVLYAPDFPSHGTTATTGFLGSYTPYTAVSQTPVSGSGTSADPYTVVTTADAGASGLRIVQTDKYVVGEEAYRTDVTIQNTSAAAREVILYRAGDCFLGASDLGFGIVDATAKAVACRGAISPTEPSNRVEQWLPITGGNNYFEANYSEVWSAIATKQPLPDTCECGEYQDNGAGISWSISIPAEGEATRSHLTKIIVPATQEVTYTANDTDTNPCDPSFRSDVLLKHPNGGVDVLAVALAPDPPCADGKFSYTAEVGCPDCELRVRVYDGFQSAEALVANTSGDTFSATPIASINNPAPNKSYFPNDAIVLEGDGRTEASGPLPDSNLAWTSPAPNSLFSDTKTGRRVELQPPNGHWPSGTYDIKLTASNGSRTDSKTVRITIVNDLDGDRMTDEFEACLGPGAGSDPLNGGLDKDVDGRKNSDERFTQNGPCLAETSYYARDAVWSPDPFDASVTSGSILVSNITVDDRPQVPREGIRITEINGQGVVGCKTMDAQSVTWVRGVYSVKFQAEPFANCVRDRGLVNRRVLVRITGNAGTWHWDAYVDPCIVPSRGLRCS